MRWPKGSSHLDDNSHGREEVTGGDGCTTAGIAGAASLRQFDPKDHPGAGLIAASRISGAQARVAATNPYSQQFTAMLSALAASAPTLEHPLLVSRPRPARAGVLVITSDRGMCGGYNTKVLHAAERLLRVLRDEGKIPVLYVMGRKGLQFCSFRGLDVAESWTGFSQQPAYADTAEVSDHLVTLFLAGDSATTNGQADGAFGVDELHIVSTTCKSMLTQLPVTTRIAPLTAASSRAELGVDLAGSGTRAPVDAPPFPDYEFEPDQTQLLDAMLPKFVRTRIYSALLNSALAELAARCTAMGTATESADELVMSLRQRINHARQAQITEEINEIISGANALADPTQRVDRRPVPFYAGA